MPEGPEIRRVADSLRHALLNQPVQVQFYKAGSEHCSALVNGQRVRAVRAVGKALLIEFDNDRTIYCHSQLYGRWKVLANDKDYRTSRQLRLLLQGPTRQARLYSASTIELLGAPELLAHPFLSKLGPDLLDLEVTAPQLLEHLMQPQFRGRQLGALLLDQAAFCGSGNYLRSEILHLAQIHPLDCLKSLRSTAREGLAESALLVARRAYQTGGITNAPQRVAAMRKQRLPRRLYRHLVFGRDGKPCYQCDQPVEKLTLGGRRLYLCRNCQRPAKV